MIKLIAVDDDSAYLDSLSRAVFLPNDQEFQLSLCISNMHDDYNVEFMLEKIGKIRPDIVLMDLSFKLVGRSSDFGIELVKKILEKYPGQKIIMLVGDESDSDPIRADKIMRSFQAGAAAYIGKREIVNSREAILEVINGDKYISKETSKILVNGIGKDAPEARLKYKLTDRHLEVLWLLSQDFDILNVAAQMRNSKGEPLKIHTINFHLKTIRSKLVEDNNMGTLHGLVAKAIRLGLID